MRLRKPLFIIIIIVSISGFLAFYDKFNSTIGVVFGTIIGYFFGKKIPENKKITYK
jgi:hypothetical protein